MPAAWLQTSPTTVPLAHAFVAPALWWLPSVRNSKSSAQKIPLFSHSRSHSDGGMACKHMPTSRPASHEGLLEQSIGTDCFGAPVSKVVGEPVVEAVRVLFQYGYGPWLDGAKYAVTAGPGASRMPARDAGPVCACAESGKSSSVSMENWMYERARCSCRAK